MFILQTKSFRAEYFSEFYFFFIFFYSQQNGVSCAPFRAHDTNMVRSMRRQRIHITAHLSAILCCTSDFARYIYSSLETLRSLPYCMKIYMENMY